MLSNAVAPSPMWLSGTWSKVTGNGGTGFETVFNYFKFKQPHVASDSQSGQRVRVADF